MYTRKGLRCGALNKATSLVYVLSHFTLLVTAKIHAVGVPAYSNTGLPASLHTSKHLDHKFHQEDTVGGSNALQPCNARSCLRIYQDEDPANALINVQIVNICLACSLCHAHALCPNFVSDVEVNPEVFRRLRSTSICLLNGAHAISPGHILLFTYGAVVTSVITPYNSMQCRGRSRAIRGHGH